MWQMNDNSALTIIIVSVLLTIVLCVACTKKWPWDV